MTRGRIPKPTAMRQRGPRASTRALLPPSDALRTRDLPDRDDGRPWHPRAVELWSEVLASPLHAELIAADVTGLLVAVELAHLFWTRPSAKAAAELRHLLAEFGLTPIARRRLQWSIARVVEATGRIEEPMRIVSDPRRAILSPVPVPDPAA